MTEYYPHNENLSKDLYEKRFWQRFDTGEDLNVVGYGKGSKFIPPIKTPTTLIEFFDRWVITMSSIPIYELWHYYTGPVLNAWAAQDHDDGYTYNNADAAGSQLYPSGIHKYWDMYSEEGIWEYVSYFYFTGYIQSYLISFTLIPYEAWSFVFEGNLGDWTYMFFYPSHYQMAFSPLLLYNPIALYMTIPGSETPWALRMMDAKISGGWDVL